MNILKRNLAPISDSAWNEINGIAKSTLMANLSGRKFLDIDGPHGMDFTSINLGRLNMGKSISKEEVQYGIYMVRPLVEARMNFSLKTWELDNIERGARDIQLDSLVDAAKKIAAFEEKAIYKGFEPGDIMGIQSGSSNQEIKVKLDNDAILDGIAEGQTKMKSEGVDGNADFIVNPSLWRFLSRESPLGSLRGLIEKQIGGRVIYSEFVENGLLVANRGGDAELIVGQDISIGYHHHTFDEVFLFFSESFSFRVITPEAIIGISI